MNSQPPPRCTAFVHHQRVVGGPYAHVAQALAGLDLPSGSFLVFDDASGTQVDYPWPVGYVPALPAPAEAQDEPPAAPAVGRPRLGVVAKEVTLLPRHWEWLASQPGGASVALRKLVDDARRALADKDRMRLAQERTYAFMSNILNNEAGFEEAARSLFA